ncbi:MAG TPA: DUF1877 family protein [Chloroflexia bacterium]|nr:DUF1877 family protein [Chloroflexia bacterium]
MYYSYIEVHPDELGEIQQDLELLPVFIDPDRPKSLANRIDLGKASEVIYFLVTGKSVRDGSKISMALLGQDVLKDDYESEPYLGYTYYLKPDQVQEVLAVLGNLSVKIVESRVESTNMVAEVFPGIWKKGIDIAIKYLVGEYNKLLEFYYIVASNRNAVIITIE